MELAQGFPFKEKCLIKQEPKCMTWADQKYHDDRPVLTNMGLISWPSKRIFMDPTEIQRLCTRRRAQGVIEPLGISKHEASYTHLWKPERCYAGHDESMHAIILGG